MYYYDYVNDITPPESETMVEQKLSLIPRRQQTKARLGSDYQRYKRNSVSISSMISTNFYTFLSYFIDK